MYCVYVLTCCVHCVYCVFCVCGVYCVCCVDCVSVVYCDYCCVCCFNCVSLVYCALYCVSYCACCAYLGVCSPYPFLQYIRRTIAGSQSTAQQHNYSTVPCTNTRVLPYLCSSLPVPVGQVASCVSQYGPRTTMAIALPASITGGEPLAFEV